jgi:AcrR family transcriptional regulator
MTSPPLSRAARQERTREALVRAAREVFARDGFHAARLDAIARAAGFSKGAVYSNFGSKAELFLAAVDLNLAAVLDVAGSGAHPVPEEAPGADGASSEEVVVAIRGFAVATLEFIAAAARHEELTEQLAVRYRRVIDAHAQTAARERSPEDALPPEQLGILLTALDQGFALLTVSGITTAGQDLLAEGLRRLVSVPSAATTPGPQSLTALGTGTAQSRLTDDAARRDRG